MRPQLIFLGRRRVAVTGVSRHPKSHGIACFDPTAARRYKAMRVFFTLRGNVPRQV
jgi:hypothetical protein